MYIDALSRGMSKRDALDYAGYSKNSAAARIENQSVKSAIARVVRQRAPAHKIAARIAEGLDATETKFFQKDGKITDTAECVNYGERRAYAELAARLGYEDEENKDTGGSIKLVIETIGFSGKITAKTE